MFIIGLTGGIGSGKSTVSQLFAELGITIIDTDIIARDVVKPNTPTLAQIKQHFGSAIINEKNELDRNALRKKIFSNLEEKKWLENLLHPLIRAEAHRQATAAQSPYCIVVIPLLFETKKNEWLNRILVVEASPVLQIQRVAERDHCDTHDVEKIIQTQVSADVRRKGANDIIGNNGSLADLKTQVEKLHQLYLSLAKE